MTTQTTLDYQSITLTICPDDKHQYVSSPTRVRQVSDYVRTLMYNSMSDKYFRYTMYTEVSYPEVSKDGIGGRIHFHGTVYFVKPYSKPLFFTEVISKLNQSCRLEHDTISDADKWRNYCTKDQSEMEPYCVLYKTPWMFTETSPKPALIQVGIQDTKLSKLLKRSMDTEEL